MARQLLAALRLLQAFGWLQPTGSLLEVSLGDRLSVSLEAEATKLTNVGAANQRGSAHSSQAWGNADSDAASSYADLQLLCCCHGPDTERLQLLSAGKLLPSSNLQRERCST